MGDVFAEGEDDEQPVHQVTVASFYLADAEISVGQFRRRGRVRDFVRERRRSWDPSTFEVREVSLIERGDPPDDVFRLDRTVSLGGATT